MSTSDDYQVPVRDGHAVHPKHTPEEMYWLSHLNQKDLCEKYVGLKDDFYTLKTFSRKQEDKIKKEQGIGDQPHQGTNLRKGIKGNQSTARLQTKLRKIIADKKKDGNSKDNASCSVQEMEYQDVLETQRQSIRELRLKNDHLERKLKLANIQLSAIKKNKPLLFRHVGARVDSGLKAKRPPVSPQVKQLVQPNLSPAKPTSSDESLALTSAPSVHQANSALPEIVREILEEARKKILDLEAERDDLQEHLLEKQQCAEDTEYELQQKIAMLEEEVLSLREDLQDHGVREERETVAVVRAERETRTLTARITALQEQLAMTEEKVTVEKSRKDALQNELEMVTGKLLEAENQLRELQQEHQKALGQFQQVTEKKIVLEKENGQLQKENEQLATINRNFEHQQLAAENETLKTQIAHLESALQSDLIERGSLLEHMTSDKEALATLEIEVKHLRESNLSLQQHLEKTNHKLNIYSKAGLLDLTKKDFVSSLTKQEEDNAKGMSTKDTEALREAHSELQLVYREKMLELEKITSTLTSHSQTYKALQDQVTRVTQESQDMENDLRFTIKNLQETIKRRDERCEKLEHQMLMITDKGLKEKLDSLGHNLTRTVSLGKHDNVLEFHIDKVAFEAPEFSQLKTFVSWTVPFSLEDPLQHTNVSIGTDARYNYSALYKFQMNYRNIESLREDNVTVSVYILHDSGHPAKVGECRLTFSEVLDHPRNTLHGTVQVLVNFDDAEDMQHLPAGLNLEPGQVIGTMNYWFHLQRPCEEIIAQHLRTLGVLVTTQQQQFFPKASTVIKSKNPVKSKTIVNKECDESSAGILFPSDTRRRRSSMEQPSNLKCPIPAPRSQSHASLLIEKQEANPQESEETKFHQVSLESSSQINGNEPVMHVPSNTDSITFQEQCLQSSSPQSYNKESLFKANINQTSDNDDCKNHRSVTSKKKYSSRCDQSGGHDKCKSSSVMDRRAARPKNAATVRPTRHSTGENSRNSVIIESHATLGGHLANQSQVFKQRACSSEENLTSSSQDGSDTMFEESNEPDTDTDESHQIKIFQKSPEKLIIEVKGKEDVRSNGGIKSSTGVHSKNVQEVYSASSPRTSSSGSQAPESCSPQTSSNKSQASGRQPSSSECSLATDSEGVVAVASKKQQNKQLRIYIEVCSLILHADSSVTQDPLVEFLFVDYHGFLGLPPDQLETPLSLPKAPPGCKLKFNFKQEFVVDKKQHPERMQALVDLMKNRGIIKFTVTSEPPEELQETQDCEDLGYAYVNLHDLLRKGEDLQDAELIVESADDGSQMGVLNVTLRIVDVLTHFNITS
ncbi:protein fantom isoform X2 [Procambarus clarkii]|uniref:protein fantom isoform X2 n=1 Tax=Procambarus clarkii TaxID=6728 RepID=UPI003743F7D5